ncbi:MAG: hypothetical protein NC045_06250 [Bacteroides sp.]|nr:hypothetical protein [Bacteroides sp.]
MTIKNLTGFLASLSIAALCLSATHHAEACTDIYNGGYCSSPFMVAYSFENDQWGNNTAYDETIDFWNQYLKGAVTRESIKNFFDHATIDSVTVSRNAFMRRLKKKRDNAAIEYISRCLELSRVIEKYQGDSWEYEKPSKAGFEKLLAEIDAAKVPASLIPRYEFLKIRIYGAMGDNEGVMKVWNNSGKNMKPSALRNRMEGYVGGVLYRQGKYVEALDYFYRSGDEVSISWCIDKIVGAANMKSLYEHNPNSLALRYILQDYMNYLIASSEAGRAYGKARKLNDDDDLFNDDYTYYSNDIRSLLGKPIYDAAGQRKEMMKLFKQILDEKKTETPMMWATALGVLQTMEGNCDEGVATMKKAAALQGDKLMASNLDNFTIWALMLQSGKGNATCDAEFINGLKRAYATLERTAAALTYDYSKAGRARRTAFDEDRSRRIQSIFFTKFFSLEAETHFKKLQQPQRAFSIIAMFDVLPPYLCEDTFLQLLRSNLDKNLSIDDARKFVDYAKAKPSDSNVIDEYLQPYAAQQLNLANDVIGTRLMRQMQFDEALTYLEKVDPRWIKTQAISPYLRGGYYKPTYYNFQRTCTTPNQDFYGYPNTKAQYCSEMIDALDQYKTLSGDDKAMKALEIAAMLHFASPLGDGWAISEYAWSCYIPENEFSKASREWLQKASGLSDAPLTRSIAAYAMLCFPGSESVTAFDTPFGQIMKNGKIEKYYIDSPTDHQLKALNYLKLQWNSVKTMPYHITSCDVLESYMAGNFVDKDASDL